MRKYIRGKYYNTDSAKLIGETSYSNPSDFHYCYEAIYRKRTGEFFLYGEGGGLSKYRTASGPNSWGGGEKITPMSVQEAKEWIEENLDADAYEECFGKVEEDGSTSSLTVILPSATVELLRRKAGETGDTMSEIVNKCITDCLII